jgi:F-type H+-transporting ATPase subunit delta
MAELSTVARPYAEALFSAVPLDGVAKIQAELLSLNLVASDQTVQSWFKNPFLSQKDKVDALTAAFSAQHQAPISELMNNFLLVLIQNNRLSLLSDVSEQFTGLKNKAEGANEAIITSAFDLTSEQLSDLTSNLQKKFGVHLKPVLVVDPTLIGGVRVRVGDQVLDTSVRAQLDAMKAALVA